MALADIEVSIINEFLFFDMYKLFEESSLDFNEDKIILFGDDKSSIQRTKVSIARSLSRPSHLSPYIH